MVLLLIFFTACENKDKEINQLQKEIKDIKCEQGCVNEFNSKATCKERLEKMRLAGVEVDPNSYEFYCEAHKQNEDCYCSCTCEGPIHNFKLDKS